LVVAIRPDRNHQGTLVTFEGVGDTRRMTTPTVPAARTALVTGASRGIGAALATALAAAGLDVALLARDGQKLTAVAEQVEALGRRAVVLAADVTDRVAVDAAAREAELALGSLDLLVNNAGRVHAEVPLWPADAEQFPQVRTTQRSA